MKNLYKFIIKLSIGIIMISTVLIGYIPEPEYFIEFTCLSNLICGIVIIIDGILNLKNKQIPNFIYIGFISAMWVLAILCLVGALGLYQLNFRGAFFFLHSINPVLYIVAYLFLYEENDNMMLKKILIAPYFVCLYFIFDYIFGLISGNFFYQLFEVSDINFGYAILIFIAIYLLTALFGFLSIILNKLINKKSYS